MAKQSHAFRGMNPREVYRIYRTFLPHIGGYWKWSFLAYLALFAAMGMNLLKPWLLKFIFDYILLNEPMPHRIRFLDSMAGHDKLVLPAVLCVGLVVIFFLEDLFTFARKYLMSGLGERAINDIRQQVFGHLQMLEHRTDRSADLVVRLTSDTDSLNLLLTQHVQTLVNYVFTVYHDRHYHVADRLAVNAVKSCRGSNLIFPIGLFLRQGCRTHQGKKGQRE